MLDRLTLRLRNFQSLSGSTYQFEIADAIGDYGGGHWTAFTLKYQGSGLSFPSRPQRSPDGSRTAFVQKHQHRIISMLEKITV